jgi:peptidyl-prolyl cis-trans isomerase B (cyclophilin B)
MPVRVGRAVDAAVAEALARPVGQPEQPEQPGGEQPQPGSGVTGSGEGGVVGTETTPGTTTPPAETTPGTTTPTETTPGTTSPPAETTPGTTTPPAETTPGTTTPPAETTPGTATPPAETTPGTTTPPAETTPPPMTTDTPPAPSPPVEPGAVPTPGEGTTEPSPPAETTPPPAERPAEPARMFPDATGPVVELEVKNRGSVYVELYPKAAPKTSSAFLYLVREGFYDQTYFHRRVADFVVQGGDPLSRDRPLDDPELGTGGPEWTVPGEFSRELHHERGTLGLARAPSDPDSGGSQFYVCLSNQPTLDGQYAIFGHVVQGMNIVDQIQVGDRIVKAKVVQGADSTNAAGVGPLDLFKGQ